MWQGNGVQIGGTLSVQGEGCVGGCKAAVGWPISAAGDIQSKLGCLWLMYRMNMRLAVLSTVHVV